MPTNNDIMDLFGTEPSWLLKQEKKVTKGSVAKKASKASDFKTTRRVVGGEESSMDQQKACLVYGGMVVEIPEEAFLAWLRGMEGKGWSALRHDEHTDLVGGMREIARRMGVAPKQAAKRMKKRAAEKPDDEPNLDKLLDDL